MDAARLKFVIEACYRKQRLRGEPKRYEDTAEFLGVSTLTLRRWLRGERPVPRMAAIILEIFHHWPEIDAKAVDKWVEGGEREIKALDDEKQH